MLKNKQWMMLGTALMLASLVLGQKDSVQTAVLNDVIITANKVEQKQSSTGKVVSVITKEQIEKSAGKSVSQLLNEQAGITINGALNNAGSVQTTFMRGASSGRTLLLLDGIPMNDPSMINNEFDLNLFSLNDVERIEVCRGAQSTLYGSDAVAGVINIITVKKDINKPVNVKATISAGNFNTFKGNLQLYGKLKKFSYTTRYAKLYTKGFSSAYDSSGKSNFDKDGYNGDVTNATARYDINKQLAVKTYLQYSRYKTDVDASIFRDDKDFVVTNKNLTTGAGIEYRTDLLSLTGNYRYSDVNRNYFNDSTDNPGTLGRDDYFGKSQFVEVFANIKMGKYVSFLQGADYRFNGMNQENFGTYPASPWGPAGSFGSHLDSTMSQASLYGSLFVHTLNNKLNIELGGRLNVHSRYGSNGTYTFNPSYTINNHFRVFGSIATGFKAPSVYQLYSSSGNPDLEAESSENFEFGIQNINKKITSRLVYFNRNIDNGIDFDYNSFTYFNYIKQRVQGLEFETALQATEKFRITANYTFLDAKEQTQSRETFKDTSYNYVLRRPKHNVNANLGYQFTKALFASVTGKYVSDRKDVVGYMAKDIKLDAYFILGTYVEYQLNTHTRFFADLQNITNRKFFDLSGYNSIPFMINAGVTCSF
ncbi:MAG: TonB-dependent receptor [Bacteroidota bacterium]